MKHISPTILALAAIVPSIAALDVKDDDVKLGLTLQLQVRAERGIASNNTGDQYAITDNSASKPDTADFYLRRFRLGFKGSYQGDYKFAAQLRVDNADRTGSGTPATSGGTAASTPPAGTVVATNSDPTNRMPQIHVAYIERVFKQEDLGLEHSIRAGLDYAFFNGASGVFSSSSFLLPSGRASENSAFLAPRGVGVGYKLSGKIAGVAYTWGADIQNNISDDSASVTGFSGGVSSNQHGEGLCYTTRLQFVPYDSDAKGHMKPVESFVGAPGTGILLSVEAGVNKTNNNGPAAGTAVTAANTNAQNLKAEGVEVLVHHNGLTALAEGRWAQLATDANTLAASTNVGRLYYAIQAGYALPIGDQWIEPAFRASRIEFDNTAIETSNYSATSGTGVDYGSSGYQYEAGVNWYLNKHQNKLQLDVQRWRGEQSGAATADKSAQATVLRAQWQLSF